MRTSARFLVTALVCVLPAVAHAQDSAATRPPCAPRDSTPRELAPLTVIGRRDNLTGIATSASQGHVGSAEIGSRPLTREGEMLETVPGVIVTQHSGDGKANQYFVRGFNLDHGTDFATRLEGMPVNMPSHAHGQGYTDLNFLIPEFVDYLDYRLGVAHAEMGDFGSAGGAEFRLVTALPRPFAHVEGGAFGMARLAAGGSTALGAGDLLVGGEVKRYDGPWLLDQEIRKVSTLARYTWTSGSSTFSLLGMAYHNTWNSTDQIPVRAVSGGLISRFGNLDPSDGGHTQRYSLSGTWRHAGASAVHELQVYGIYSDLSLFSNFSFFLSDTVNGDQFNQRESRAVTGASLKRTQALSALGASHVWKAGLQTRADVIGNLGLHLTAARRRLSTVRQDDVTEWGTGAWTELESRWSPRVRTVAGLRADGYLFHVNADRAGNGGTRRAGIVSPKLSLVLAPADNVELYLSGGLGFHSNDARGTTIRTDPLSGAPVPRVDPLVRSRGAELGLRVSPAGLRSTLSLWVLGLGSELLFVGDGGTTEPSFASRRVGVTWANYWQPIPALALDLDVSLARARFTGVPAGQDRVPGALENVVAAGVTWLGHAKGPFGAVRLRHFGRYALIEDNSVRARPSSLVNAELGWRFGAVRVTASVLNVLDAKDRDIQYYYTSRLAGEPAAGVDDIHFHPSEPRQLRVMLGWGR
ncbi:MAG: TonB-dependent receptor [Gemmatimonadetes bacterium]|nr:TonB-dependent receptor [Gemmatimonadota bacterium]